MDFLNGCSSYFVINWTFITENRIEYILLSITIGFVYETKYPTLRNIGEHRMSVLYTGSDIDATMPNTALNILHKLKYADAKIATNIGF